MIPFLFFKKQKKSKNVYVQCLDKNFLKHDKSKKAQREESKTQK
jgi:hypothetical protein